RTAQSSEEFVAHMEEAVRAFGRDEFSPSVWEELASRPRSGGTEYDGERKEDKLAPCLTERDGECETRGNRVYYLAVPPAAMPILVEGLGPRRTTTGWVRLLVEKPFGRDPASAPELN